MNPQPPLRLDYAQSAATADEEVAALLAAIDFRKPISGLLKNNDVATRLADRLPNIFEENYGESTCGETCVQCGSTTAERLKVGWQCDLVSWRLRRYRYIDVVSACPLCVECARSLATRIASTDLLIKIGMVSTSAAGAVLIVLRHGWIALLLFAVAVALGITRYGTLRGCLPDTVVSRFPIWVRWTGVRGYSVVDHPLNRIDLDFSRLEEGDNGWPYTPAEAESIAQASDQSARACSTSESNQDAVIKREANG